MSGDQSFDQEAKIHLNLIWVDEEIRFQNWMPKDVFERVISPPADLKTTGKVLRLVVRV